MLSIGRSVWCKRVHECCFRLDFVLFLCSFKAAILGSYCLVSGSRFGIGFLWFRFVAIESFVIQVDIFKLIISLVITALCRFSFIRCVLALEIISRRLKNRGNRRVCGFRVPGIVIGENLW